MNLIKKVITTYAKSLIQNLKANPSTSNAEIGFTLSKIISIEPTQPILDIYSLGEELLLIRYLILSSKSITEFFKNPTYSESKKLNIIVNIFPGLSLYTQSFLKILIERKHLGLLPEISEEYTKILLLFKNSVRVNLITATGLREYYGLPLLNTLRILTKSKEILLTVFYNPQLLGGAIIEYNSKSIDASILKELSLFFSEA